MRIIRIIKRIGVAFLMVVAALVWLWKFQADIVDLTKFVFYGFSQ